LKHRDLRSGRIAGTVHRPCQAGQQTELDNKLL
jgi:hypothetical protein